MYIYSGIDILRHPTSWFWAVRPLFRFFPSSVQAGFTQPSFMSNFLRAQGAVEILFAFVLLAWFLPKKYAKWVAGISTLEMAGILLFIPIDAITFRDFGLLGASLALFLLLRGEFKEVSVVKSYPVQENKIDHKPTKEGEPLVQTFDEFIGQK